MNISLFASDNSVYINCEYIKGYTFKKFNLEEKSALFYKLTDCFECILPQCSIPTAV